MNRINPIIFRAYDIRGIYPQEINEETAYLIGRAFVKFLKKKRPEIVVGRDNRLSSPVLAKALIRGIIEEGGKVIDIGLSTSPMLYWAVAHYKFDGGVNCSASHNPPQYGGFKMLGEKATFLSEKTGLKKIKKIAQELAEKGKAKIKKGKLEKREILKDYLRFSLKDFKREKTGALKVVIDTGNAVPGILISELKKKVPFKIYHLFSKLDASFPNRSLNPLEPRALKALQEEVKSKKADLGIAFDGDGDRIIFVSEKGKQIPGDLIFALMAKIILKKAPGQKILYNICSSRIVGETIKENGGVPIMERVGHAFIKERMKKEKIPFAGEFSGHYYLKEDYFSEAPFFILFNVVEEMAKTKKPISWLIKPYQKYFNSGEINFEAKNKEKILEKVEKKYQRGKILKIDGLRIDFKDWWFLLRPSQTEPVLRLILEAKTKKLMLQKKKEIIKLVLGK